MRNYDKSEDGFETNMSNDTREKLEETEYFLHQLSTAYNAYKDNNTEENYNATKFNFSAFLSAARSITYFMKKQYTHIGDFLTWYAQKEEEMKKDLELRCLNEARVKYIHKRTVSLGHTQTISFSASMRLVSEESVSESQSDQQDISEPTEAEADYTSTIQTKVIGLFLPRCKYLKDNTDLLKFCERQLDKLTLTVTECEEKYLIAQKM
jgi:hypothetical protein